MDDLTQARIEQALHRDSRPTPIDVQFAEQTGSTNADALAWLQSRPFRQQPFLQTEWRVFVAEAQQQGRGRQGKSWVSAPGESLTFTLAIPELSPHFLPYIAMEGAVSLIYLFRERLPTISIKWPNDVQVNGRKVCGILSEAAWSGDTLLGVVLGMGLNVSNRFEGTAFEATATSLEAELNVRLDRAETLSEIVNGVEQFRRMSYARAHQLYRTYLNTLGKSVRIQQGDTVIEGMAEDVDEVGALLVRGADGELRRAVAGDLFMV